MEIEEKRSYFIDLIKISDCTINFANPRVHCYLKQYPEEREYLKTVKWHECSADSSIVSYLSQEIEFYSYNSLKADLDSVNRLINRIYLHPDQFYVSGYYSNILLEKNESVKTYNYIYILDHKNNRFWEIHLSS